MEENMNMTAERSLEIITEQIAQSRKAVSKRTGQSLYVAGMCTMGMAVVVAMVNIAAVNNGFSPLGHLLWFVLPVVIWLAMRKINNKERVHAPESFVASLVGKTWWTFGVLVLGFFILANVWNVLIVHLATDVEPVVAVSQQVKITPVIILLMAMAISITGHILKSNWLVWFGIIGGLVVAVGDYAGIISAILARTCSIKTVGVWHFVSPCLSVFLFALIGLMLPGLMLKRQK